MRLREQDIWETITGDPSSLRPLSIISLNRDLPLGGNYLVDAVAELSIEKGPSFEAIVEVKARATPKIVLQTAQQLRAILQNGGRPKAIPLIIAPYIGREAMRILEEEGVSWIDLSGNMVISVPGCVYIERTGKRNRFPDTEPIKKIFEGTSSLVIRALLLNRQGFSSLYEIVDFINELGAQITVSTVSKILKSLEQEMLIRKTKESISVTNADGLLLGLSTGYANYISRRTAKASRFAVGRIDCIAPILNEKNVKYAACGFYAAELKGLAATDLVTIFVKSIERTERTLASEGVDISLDSQFGQLELIQTKNPCVWFNIQRKSSWNVVDDIELFVEMMAETPRGPKVAEVLKKRILGDDNRE